MEVVTIEREEWKSVETNNGGECVMILGMKETLLLYADSLDSQEKVFSSKIKLIITMLR